MVSAHTHRRWRRATAFVPHSDTMWIFTSSVKLGVTRAPPMPTCTLATARPFSAGRDLGCLPVQTAPAGEDRRCWGELMRRRLQVARRSPFALTLMIDTDVFANPFAHTDRPPLESLLRLFQQTAIDVAFGSESNWFLTHDADPRSALNAGFVAWRASARTDRLFSCAQTLIQHHSDGWAWDDQAALPQLVLTCASEVILALPDGDLFAPHGCFGGPANCTCWAAPVEAQS